MDEQAKEAILTAMSARSNEPFSDGEMYYPAIDSTRSYTKAHQKVAQVASFLSICTPSQGEVGGGAERLLA